MNDTTIQVVIMQQDIALLPNEYWHPAQRKPFDFAEVSNFRYWELLQYPSQSEPQLYEGSISNDDLEGWFAKVIEDCS